VVKAVRAQPIALAVGAATLLLFTMACGKTAKRSNAVTAVTPITTKQLVDEFEKRTGEKLYRRANPGIPTLSAPRDILWLPKDASKRYGDFRIDVFRNRTDAETTVLSSKEPSAGGDIYWKLIPAEHEGDRSVWLATKLYGNVVLSWSNDQERIDARWHRLDSILSDLER
jgi:hypothetical protein